MSSGSAYPDLVCRYVGPQPREDGKAHLAALRTLQATIARDGYRPGRHPKGFITGCVLTDGEDFRFMAVDGQHRLAALRSLGATDVRVRLWGGPSVVSPERLPDWTIERHGLFTRAVATLLFERMFTATGRSKAAALGLA